MHLDHVNIRAPGRLLHEVRGFYLAVLGLEEGFRPDFGSPGFWLYAGEQAVIHLSADEDCDPDEGPGGFGHFALRGMGLAAMEAKLQSLGLAYRSNLVPELDMTQLFFEDPAGVTVELQFVGEHVPVDPVENAG